MSQCFWIKPEDIMNISAKGMKSKDTGGQISMKINFIWAEWLP